MKKLILLVALLLAVLPGMAQIRLVGAGFNDVTNQFDIFQWEALDSTSVTSQPSLLQGIYLGSSLFDAYSSNYYLTGMSIDTTGLYSYNTETGAQNITGFTNFSNISEIDMSTGKIYNLRIELPGTLLINEYDIATGQDSLVGAVTEPGIPGIIVDATGFDSNNGILYYIGYDGSNAICLFGFHVRAAPFFYTKIPIVTEALESNIYGLNYDNVTDQLFANQAVFDTVFSYIHNRIVEVSTATGEVIPRGVLTGFTGFVVGSSCYDQFSGSYMIVGVDTNFTFSMIVFNTSDNTYLTGFVPPNTSEIVCDNHDFSTAFYLTSVGRTVAEDGLKVYPNPAGATLNVTLDKGIGAGKLTLTGLSGRVALTSEIEAGEVQSLDVSRLARGCYLLHCRDEGGVHIQKVFIR